MTLQPLYPPIMEDVAPGWRLEAREAGRTGRGITATLAIMNGEAKGLALVAFANDGSTQDFVAKVQTLSGADTETVHKALLLIGLAVDQVLRQRSAERSEPARLPGKPVDVPAITPWDTAVEGTALLEALCDTYNRYVILPPGGAEALSLWTLHTYLTDVADHTPYINLSSPQKRCGKTTVLSIASALVYKPVPLANISPAAVYRTIDSVEPCLLVDEADTFLSNPDLKGLFNSGHTRSSAFVIRCVGDNQEPRQFSTWGPRLIAGIGKLPATIADRSIVLPMKRRKATEKVTKWRETDAAALAALCRKCLRWANDHRAALKDATPRMPDRLHDRAQDHWAPLMAIAERAGAAWAKRACEAVDALESLENADNDHVAIQLLHDMRALFVARNTTRLLSADLVEALTDMEERPWPEWRKGRPITARQIARLLDDFGIHPKPLRDGTGRARGYDKEDCLDAFLRYLEGESIRDSVTDEQRRGFAEKSMRDTPDAVTDEKTRKPASEHTCHAVTDRKGDLDEQHATMPTGTDPAETPAETPETAAGAPSLPSRLPRQRAHTFQLSPRCKGPLIRSGPRVVCSNPDCTWPGDPPLAPGAPHDATPPVPPQKTPRRAPPRAQKGARHGGD